MQLELRVGRLYLSLDGGLDVPEEVPGLRGVSIAEQVAATVADLWEEEPGVRQAAVDARRALLELAAALEDIRTGAL